MAQQISNPRGEETGLEDILMIPTPEFSYVVGTIPGNESWLFRTFDERDWSHEHINYLYELKGDGKHEMLILLAKDESRQTLVQKAATYAHSIIYSFQNMPAHFIQNILYEKT